MQNTKAIVTIAIGDAYVQPWKNYCYPGWKRYADLHGYDIVLITGLLDTSPRARTRSPSWQRLLILQLPEVAKYAEVVWVDADIAINAETAPCIVETASRSSKTDKTVGVVIDSDHTTPRDDAIIAAVNRRQQRLNQTLNQGMTWQDVYRLNGLGTKLDQGFNAGVMVLKPQHHAAVLQEVYETYDQTPVSWLEGVPLAFHLLSRELVHAIPRAFNVNAAQLFYEHYPFMLANQPIDSQLLKTIVDTMHENSYFLHFLGGGVVRAAMQHVPKPS